MSGSAVMSRKIINVTGKRQITIPQKFYNFLGMGKEIECELTDNALMLRPFRNDTGFATEILKDLVSQGLSGNELIEEFEKQHKKISMAIGNLAMQADEIAAGKSQGATLDEVFGPCTK